MLSDQIKSRLTAIFNSGNVKFKQIDAFGSNVVITCWSESVARRIAAMLKSATFQGVETAKSVDYNVVNAGGSNRPSNHIVWLVRGRI